MPWSEIAAVNPALAFTRSHRLVTIQFTLWKQSRFENHQILPLLTVYCGTE